MNDDSTVFLANKFKLDSIAVKSEPYGNGHINTTYLISTENGKKYILQKISDAFDIKSLMKNIDSVTSFIAFKAENPERQLHLIYTLDEKPFLPDNSGNYRMYNFIENSICLNKPESTDDFYESAVAFGSFQKMLEDFPATTLTEPIKNFHNTPDRYRILKETIARDPLGRVKETAKEIEFALKREKEAGILQSLLESGELPIRVTHNDTKLNNVLLDKTTRKALCVIDLDTVMPGLSLYDFGDAIRFGAATAAEDEKCLDKMTINIDMFKAFTKGYLSSCNLTKKEIEYLPYGAKIMTLECGIRFLTDYIDGDNYFKTKYACQNLDRCRAQFKLVSEMEKHFEEMKKIISEQKFPNRA